MSALRVLLINNDPKQSESISTVLADANHTVLPASGFEEASEALLIQKFDAVLLGSALPAEAIAHFTASLREMERSQRTSGRTPVLSFSPAKGNAPPNAGKIPVDAYLPENFEPAAFVQTVESLASTAVTEAETSANSSPDLAILEPDELYEQVAFDRELLVEIVDLFLGEREQQLVEMSEAFALGDLPRLSRLAHTIKGSLGSLHAPRARIHAQDLEMAAKAGSRDASGSLLVALEQDLDELEPQLRALRDTANAG